MVGKKEIGIACDHAGYELKTYLVTYLKQQGYNVKDFGTNSSESVDYPDYAHKLGQALDIGELEMGISICYSGNGINMTMNHHPHVRSALCWDIEIARLARAHNDANNCALPAHFISKELALKIINTFLSTSFEGGRHQRRIEKIPLC